MNPLARGYYRLTAYVPRKLPQTQDEFETMWVVMTEAYDVKDEPQTCATIAGHISAIPSTHLRAPWGALANAGKRIAVNNLAQSFRQAAIRALEAKLKEAVKAESDRVQKEQGSDVHEGSKEVEPQAHADAVSAPSQEAKLSSAPPPETL